MSYTTAVEAPPPPRPLASYEPLPTVNTAITLPGGGPVVANPSFPPDRVATRIVIRRLGIDLPVMLQTENYGIYPLCDVAMYLPQLGQPGQGRATYIYAHARIGMFRPLLRASEKDDGASMLGMTVEVYTSDDWHFVYTISEVRRHTLEPRRRLRHDDRAAVAADLGGPERHRAQAPGRRRLPVRREDRSGRGPSGRAPPDLPLGAAPAPRPSRRGRAPRPSASVGSTATAITAAATRNTPTRIRAASLLAHDSSASTTRPSLNARSRSDSGMNALYASGVARICAHSRSMTVDPNAVRAARPIAMPIIRATVTVADAMP